LSLKESKAKYHCKTALKIIIYTSLMHMCHQVYLFQMKAVRYGMVICIANYKNILSNNWHPCMWSRPKHPPKYWTVCWTHYLDSYSVRGRKHGSSVLSAI